MRFLNDLSASAVIAGFVTVLVGFTSSAVVVFQGATAVGATPAELASWWWALGLGMGLLSIVLSLRYRQPVVAAWSTAGAALLITGAAGVSMPHAIGAFMVAGLLTAVVGFTGWFERAMSHIPLSVGAAMLAGLLLRFGLDAFVAMKTQMLLAGAMFAVYLLGRRWKPRFAVLLALASGIAISAALGLLHLDALRFEMARPIWTTPEWSLGAIVGVALPIFVVTMASQNVPGVAAIRASGYDTPVSPLVGWSGAVTLVLAPFGAFALNLAAITAAISMGRESHEDPARRYVAGVSAGVFYLLIGLFGATVTAMFSAFPRELIMSIAGLALMGTIGNGLVTALSEERQREPALITFLVTASGVTLFGVGSAFWGLVAGVLAALVLNGGFRAAASR